MIKIIKKLFAPIVVLSLALGVGLTASRGIDEVKAASPVTVDGTYFTTTDQTQTATIDGVTIGGKLKQYNTSVIFFTSGSGFIYNSTDLGSITKLTLSYNTGGSATAIQRFNFGTSAMASYLSTGGTTRNVSTGGTSYDETGGVGKGFFNISVSSKNLQLASLVIEYTGGVTTYDVSFNSAGGTPAPTSLSVSQNGTFTFPSPGTKSGYVFDGWSSDGGTTKFAAGATSPAVTAAINYTAYWSAAPTLQSINITGTLSKKAYISTESWSPAGLTVTGTYSSGPTQDVTSQVTWSYNPTAPNNVSITSVTVTATLGSQTDSENVTGITVTEKVSTVVISEVYGAGGNNNAIYKHDFVELYNNSNTTVDLTGWSLFYGSATGDFSRNNNAYTDLSGKILPKSYLLIRQAAGTSGGTEHPVLPDIQGTIALGANNFKLALTNSAVIPTDYDSANVIDFIGAGTATKFEGTVAPAAALDDSISRTLVGDIYVDTDNNGNDFTLNTGITPMNAAVSVAGRIMAYAGGDLITAECATKYSTIKAQMLLLSSGSLTYFQNSTESNIQNARLRYVAWSVANGDNTPYSAAPGRNLISSNNEENRLVAVITISVLGLTTILGYYFLKNKKFLR